ncbi:ECF sigma factor [Maioricimonas rarisocia]|uniref:ECF sigma factor n=1 Tax=Maioricimonas rarisocia TaxID=2528026 RepID=A0A517ZAW3_9PLAN|nr:ECF-type sigma factor [Maioricimonas rarisocia]QDU39569.1 ECF sigma factor [Maioricimonas rarisocia]
MVNGSSGKRANLPATGRSSAEMLPFVYDELRKLARFRMSQEPHGHTLQATALVHEVFLRLRSCGGSDNWDSRGHFLAAAAEAMRRILVERARRKQTLKRGGGWQRGSLDHLCEASDVSPAELLALDESLTRLAEEHPEKVELVKLRFFTGLTIQESAEALGVSVSTANNYWAFARSWLHLEMSESAAD